MKDGDQGWHKNINDIYQQYINDIYQWQYPDIFKQKNHDIFHIIKISTFIIIIYLFF